MNNNMNNNTDTNRNRTKFIQESILACGVGIFAETETTFVYYTGLDLILANKTLSNWWINGEYVYSPVAWAFAHG